MNNHSALTTKSLEYHIAEYDSLHSEIRELMAEARILERHALYATGALWAWLAVSEKDVPVVAWYIPLLFAIGGGLRVISLKKAVDNIADYISILDSVFSASPFLIGWETYRRKNQIKAGVMFSAKVFWWLLIIVTVMLPTVMLFL